MKSGNASFATSVHEQIAGERVRFAQCAIPSSPASGTWVKLMCTGALSRLPGTLP